MRDELDDIVSVFVALVRDHFDSEEVIPLHEPRFLGREREYGMDAIGSTYVSSVGEYVNRFEYLLQESTGAAFAVAVNTGTSALHLALDVVGVETGDEVLTQPLTFVATGNAIRYCGAHPVFLDVDLDTMGLSPDSLAAFLDRETERRNGVCTNQRSGARVRACVPMHTFGYPARIDAIVELCNAHGIAVVEDAAEALGSTSGGKQTGLFGQCGIFSFNGNKTVTCGAGGALVTDDPELAVRAKHLSTTGKLPHRWDYVHDVVGYNYRLPNLNAALACAQLERLGEMVGEKRALAEKYREFFKGFEIEFVEPIAGAQPNYWLSTILLSDRAQRDEFLKLTNDAGIMTRPAWDLLHTLSIYQGFQTGDLANATQLSGRIVNIPSSADPPANAL